MADYEAATTMAATTTTALVTQQVVAMRQVLVQTMAGQRRDAKAASFLRNDWSVMLLGLPWCLLAARAPPPCSERAAS